MILTKYAFAPLHFVWVEVRDSTRSFLPHRVRVLMDNSKRSEKCLKKEEVSFPEFIPPQPAPICAILSLFSTRALGRVAARVHQCPEVRVQPDDGRGAHRHRRRSGVDDERPGPRGWVGKAWEGGRRPWSSWSTPLRSILYPLFSFQLTRPVSAHSPLCGKTTRKMFYSSPTPSPNTDPLPEGAAVPCPLGPPAMGHLWKAGDARYTHESGGVGVPGPPLPPSSAGAPALPIEPCTHPHQR